MPPGHYHPGGYHCESGKHFVTVEAILEAPQSEVAHAIVHVFEDRISIQGFGRVTSRDLPLNQWESERDVGQER